MPHILLFFVVTLLIGPLIATAEDTTAASLERVGQVVDKFQPVILVGEDFAHTFQLWGNAKADLGVEQVDSDLGPALRISHSVKPVVAWDMQLVWIFNQPINAGDTLMMVYVLRVVDGDQTGGEGTAELYLDPDKWLREKVEFGEAWKIRTVAFTAPADTNSDEPHYITLHAGLDPQTVEIAYLRLYNFGSDVAKDQLP